IHANALHHDVMDANRRRTGTECVAGRAADFRTCTFAVGTDPQWLGFRLAAYLPVATTFAEDVVLFQQTLVARTVTKQGFGLGDRFERAAGGQAVVRITTLRDRNVDDARIAGGRDNGPAVLQRH